MITRKSYDGLNRLSAIVSSNGVAGAFSSFRYAYNSANQRTAITNADNSRWDYGYDPLGQVTSGKHYWSDNVPVAGQQSEYTYDDIGNRKTAASGGDQWGANLRYENYTANNLNQYTQRTVPGSVDALGAANSNSTVTVNLQSTYRKGEYYRGNIAIDNSSNPVWLGLTNVGVLQNGTNADIVTTNTGNVLLAKATETFAYDLDGNLLADSLWTNAWNAENRLVAVGNALGVSTNAWQRETGRCFGDGRWNERVVSAWNGASYVAQYTNRFVWDGKVLLAILNPANAVTMSFLRGLDLNGSRGGAGGAGGALAVTIATNGTHFYGYDGNGNITALVAAGDASQSALYEYDPFARTLRVSGVVAQANSLRFSTQFADEVTGDVVYLYRTLRPAFGRWLSRDPIGERSDFALHVFVQNNPISAIDMLGLIGMGDYRMHCCDQVWDEKTYCCCRGHVVLRAPADTGIKRERWDGAQPVPGHGIPYHVWLTWDGGSVDNNALIGSYIVSSPAAGPTLYGNPQPGERRMTIPIMLSKCEYDFDKLNACLSRRAAAAVAAGSSLDCGPFVDNLLSECQRESKGCTSR